MRYETIQDLFDNKVNATISWHAPEGFGWWLGDNIDGFVACGLYPTYEEAISGLLVAAKDLYPDGGPSEQIADDTIADYEKDQ